MVAPSQQDPLVSSADVPLLYGALGAVFHLELLGPDDAPRLDAVTDLVWEWFGEQLHWVNLSFEEPVERASRAEADFISSYATTLNVAADPDKLGQAALGLYAQFIRDDFEVSFNGGDDELSASPFSYRFYAEVPRASADPLASYAVIHITVPESWPLDDFVERVTRIAATLRLRWGCAGYTYSPWIVSGYAEASKGLAAHARRFIGYDVAEYTRLVKQFYAKVRTVSWLTFVGPSLVAELKAAERPLVSSGRLKIAPCGDGIVIQAGDVPERGDQNRLWYPPAYVEADTLLHSIRARDSKGMIFLGPWDEPSISDWLRRFERRVS